MKKFFFLSVVLCLVASLGFAQVSEKAPQSTFSAQPTAPSSYNALGDTLWSLDVGTPTGDIRILGCEFDGTNYWFTGAFDFTIAYLYEVSPGGVVINAYPQPAGNWGYWGWRDLAWDGSYLYAGADSTSPGMIVQIDPADGQPTGVEYGPAPINPCRAIAYDAGNDCFYTASFSSGLYKVERDNTVTLLNAVTNSTYGAAMADDMLWLWNQAGNGLLGEEFDLGSNTYTGVTFDGDQSIGGGAAIAGGAGCYDNGTSWEFIGQGQDSPDIMIAYEIPYYGPALPLEASTDYILGSDGGDVVFSLTAGAVNANKDFLILATGSGTVPGIDLPNGGNLPINWDARTDQFLNLTVGGNPNFPLYGTLDGNGDATVTMTLQRKVRYNDFDLDFAYTVDTLDWASNAVHLFIEGDPIPQPEYLYDDGTTENALGLTAGGELLWVQWFDTVPGQDTITEIKTAWGSVGGSVMPDGTAGWVTLHSDPNGDGDPSDGVLLASATTTIVGSGTDAFQIVDIPDTVVSGRFFVGAGCVQNAGTYMASMDQSNLPTAGQAWIIGDTTFNLDINTLTNNDVPPTNFAGIGYDAYVLVRAPYL